MNMHATATAHAGRDGADRRVRRAAVAAAGRRRGDGEARRRDRADQGRPADPARRGLALYRSAPAADRGAGVSTRRPTPRPVAPLLEGSAVLPVLNGVVAGQAPVDRGRDRAAPRGKADRRQLRAGARSARRRRRGRRAQHRLRRRRLSSSTSPPVPRSQRRSSCRTCRPAARRMCACRCASATAPRRRSSSGRPAAAPRSSARSAILLLGDGAEIALADRAGPAGERDASRPVQCRARQERQADAVRHERRRQAGAPGNPRHGDGRGRRSSRCAASTCLPATRIPTSPWCSTTPCRTPARPR